jgi:hypothetical protein
VRVASRAATFPLVFLLAAALLPGAAAARPQFDPFAVPRHIDARDVGDPLDLRYASFGQSGTKMVLELRTAETWQPQELAAEAICVALRQAGRRGRLCVGARGGQPALLYTRPGGTGAHFLRASVRRANSRSLAATFYPHDLRIRAGAIRWRAETHVPADAACAAPCADSVPDSGSYATTVSAFGATRCFGAAARIRRTPCDNPAQHRRLFPSPSLAEWMPDSPCARTPDRNRYNAIEPCAFGDLGTGDPPRVALIGDSHSGHLRAAVDVFAQALGWRAISITQAGCAFSTEAYPAPPPIPARCRLHTAEALRWLRLHPSVRTVFTSNSAGRGLSPRGFLAAWTHAPSSVRRIYEIRDVPRVSYTTASCVLSVMRKHARSIGACSVARSGAFPFDPAASAAAGAGGRIRLVDLTRSFCNASRCYPIIGGAYVYKDFNHLNRVFAATLGPALLRATGHAE